MSKVCQIVSVSVFFADLTTSFFLQLETDLSSTLSSLNQIVVSNKSNSCVLAEKKEKQIKCRPLEGHVSGCSMPHILPTSPTKGRTLLEYSTKNSEQTRKTNKNIRWTSDGTDFVTINRTGHFEMHCMFLSTHS